MRNFTFFLGRKGCKSALHDQSNIVCYIARNIIKATYLSNERRNPLVSSKSLVKRCKLCYSGSAGLVRLTPSLTWQASLKSGSGPTDEKQQEVLIALYLLHVSTVCHIIFAPYILIILLRSH